MLLESKVRQDYGPWNLEPPYLFFHVATKLVDTKNCFVYQFLDPVLKNYFGNKNLQKKFYMSSPPPPPISENNEPYYLVRIFFLGGGAEEAIRFCFFKNFYTDTCAKNAHVPHVLFDSYKGGLTVQI